MSNEITGFTGLISEEAKNRLFLRMGRKYIYEQIIKDQTYRYVLATYDDSGNVQYSKDFNQWLEDSYYTDDLVQWFSQPEFLDIYQNDLWRDYNADCQRAKALLEKESKKEVD